MLPSGAAAQALAGAEGASLSRSANRVCISGCASIEASSRLCSGTVRHTHINQAGTHLRHLGWDADAWHAYAATAG